MSDTLFSSVFSKNFIKDEIYLIQNPCQFVLSKTNYLLDIMFIFQGTFILVPQNSLLDSIQLEKRCIIKFGINNVWNITSKGFSIPEKKKEIK